MSVISDEGFILDGKGKKQHFVVQMWKCTGRHHALRLTDWFKYC